LIAAVGLLSGCLQTRTNVKEQEEKQVIRKQVATLQQSNADVNSRFQDVQEELRSLNGRIEVFENKQSKLDAKIDKSTAAGDARLKEYDAKLTAFREELEALKAQLTALQEERVRAAQAAQAQAAERAREEAHVKEAGPFAAAEANFDAKKWKEAILDYEKYRKANPKGKQFSTATYKIGAAFQELGMSEEAKAFYEEVVQKFPKSKEAPKAQAKLKGLSGKKK
jgi:TolA-binding protein